MTKLAQEAIGGYFGLELPMGNAFHLGAAELNSGRNALRYILRSRLPTKIYIPRYTCFAILEAVSDLGIEISYYSIDESFEPIFDFSRVKQDEAFLYTNYFGLKNKYIQNLAGIDCRFIIDNAQSFFSAQVGGFETFYSPRKFFGVPDGGYVFGCSTTDLIRDYSSERTHHLLIRLDESAEAGYKYYLSNEKLLSKTPLRAMSRLSSRILFSIDYDFVASRRKRNFDLLHSELSSFNLLPIHEDVERVAHTYPFLGKDNGLRDSLRKQNIFTATYWPEVVHNSTCSHLECHYADKIVHLPIDQRYGGKEMRRIIDSMSL